MLLIPSIDLRGGHCVRLLKGEFDAETRYDDRSCANCSMRYADAGVRWLHLVDLDGARDGTPGNRELIRQMAGQSRIRIQLGGGLRARALVDEALGGRRQPRRDRQRRRGAAAAAARTARRAWRRIGSAWPSTCASMQAAFRACAPAAGCRSTGLSLWELLDTFADTRARSMCCARTSNAMARSAGRATRCTSEAQQRFPRIAWQASGGIRSADDLARLAAMGLAAAISGKALLEGRIQLEELQPYLPDA